MEFYSNPEMVIHYTKELLNDSNSHSINEIYEYINEKTNGLGVNGSPLTYSTVNSAINDYLQSDNNLEFEKIRRGVYTKSSISENKEIEFYNKIKKILDTAMNDINKACKVDVNKFSEEELENMNFKAKKVYDALNENKKLIESELIENENLENKQNLNM